MKITKQNIKKHARKLRHVTEEELKELQGGYEKLLGGVRGMDAPMLLAMSVLGMAIILTFSHALFDFIGLVVMVYPFYLFARRDGHQEGYYEGAYDRMTKEGASSSHQEAGGDHAHQKLS